MVERIVVGNVVATSRVMDPSESTGKGVKGTWMAVSEDWMRAPPGAAPRSMVACPNADVMDTKSRAATPTGSATDAMESVTVSREAHAAPAGMGKEACEVLSGVTGMVTEVPVQESCTVSGDVKVTAAGMAMVSIHPGERPEGNRTAVVRVVVEPRSRDPSVMESMLSWPGVNGDTTTGPVVMKDVPLVSRRRTESAPMRPELGCRRKHDPTVNAMLVTEAPPVTDHVRVRLVENLAKLVIVMDADDTEMPELAHVGSNDMLPAGMNTSMLNTVGRPVGDVTFTFRVVKRELET